MLEDDFTYVIRKALKGLNLAPSEAARLAGLLDDEVLSFSRGNFSAETARQLAPVLGLNADALAKHSDYLPRPLLHPGIHRLDLPFGPERTNAWLIQTADLTLLFDTGYEATSCLTALEKMKVEKIDHIFITHIDRDHIGGIRSFFEREIPFTTPELATMAHIGGLSIEVRNLAGHFVPAVGYLIHGLTTAPVFVVGDALFAGSIGGCATPRLYQLALANLKAAITDLTDQTIILPGHGPATTLGEERASNPFL